MIEQMLSNWVCWAIVAVALVCYQQLWVQWLTPPEHRIRTPEGGGNGQQSFAGILIAVMPLLGLLGTIIGLLNCFASMALGGIDAALMSGGIADALLTTQFGLVCAIPGWLLQGFIQARLRRSVAPTKG